MDPVTALSVAAATVQFVDFSTKLITAAKGIYDSGVDHTPDALDVEAYLKNIDNALHDMSNQNASDLDFQNLVSRCRELSGEIRDMFPSPQSPSTNKFSRFIKSIGAASRHLWHKKDFEDKLKRLSQLDQSLSTKSTAHQFE